MFILDASVLLSPYLSEIVTQVDPPNFAIAATLHSILRKDEPGFDELVRIYEFEKEELARRLPSIHRELSKPKYQIIEEPQDKTLFILKDVRERLGESGEPWTVQALAEQIWGALHRHAPILALGSSVPRIWGKLKEKFPSQLLRGDLGLLVAGPTVEFKNIRIALVVFSEFDCWLIDAEAPSLTDRWNLGPEQFMNLLRFVGYSFQANSLVMQSGKSRE